MGTHDFRYNKVPIFAIIIIIFLLLLILFMGAHDYKYNKVALFLLEKLGISILRYLLHRN